MVVEDLNLIELNNVSLKYVKDKFTLYNINLSFDKGNIYEIVGDELSSKNILLRVIAGLVPCTQGEILWNEQDVCTVPIKDRGIGYISADFNFFQKKSVLKNLYYVFKIRKIPKVQAISMIENCLEQYQLVYLKDKKVKELSKFELIKIAIIRLKLVSRRILLVEDIWEELSVEQINECLSMLQDIPSTMIFATTKARLNNSIKISLKWGHVINHE